MASPTMQINENDGVWGCTRRWRPAQGIRFAPHHLWRWWWRIQIHGLNKTSKTAQIRSHGGSSHHRGQSNDFILFCPYNNNSSTTEIFDDLATSFIILLRNRQNPIVLLLNIMISQELTLPCHVPKCDNDLLHQLGRPILTLLVMILLAHNNNNINSFDNVARVWEVLSNRQS